MSMPNAPIGRASLSHLGFSRLRPARPRPSHFKRLPILCYRLSKHAPRVHRPKITFAHSGFVCSMIRSVHYYARSGDPSFILSTSNTTKYLSVTKYTMGSIGVENTASHASRTVTTQTDSHHSPLNRIIRDACQPKNHGNPQ